MTRMDWSKTRRTRDTEDAEPRQERTPLRGGSHVKPGPVKTWADMTPDERRAVLATLKGREP